MASFTTPNVSTNLVGRELSTIAFGFVKQYYTLLNKAPCFIYNFYSHDSTFIHGNIEMANEHHAEPIVGREKIRSKMEELQLNDCRAKITQIDCLETLAGGLVIQVIGELSDNGKPMRRFLQTFVLAPSPDESPRQDGDSQHTTKVAAGNVSERRGGGGLLNNDNGNNNTNNNTSNMNRPSHNQKFFVLNSIFRYQDDGHISEFEDDSAASVNANTSADSTNSGVNEVFRVEAGKQPSLAQQQPAHGTGGLQIGSSTNGASNNNADNSSRDHLRRPQATRDSVVRNADEIERLAHDLDGGVKLNNNNKPIVEAVETKRDGPRVVPNGMGNADKKNETSEKSTENVKVGNDHSQSIASSGSGSAVNNQQPTPVASVARPQPSNEPKTWANMVRNAHPHSASVQVNATIQSTPVATPTANSATPQSTAATATPTDRHQQPQQQQQQQQQQPQQNQSTNQQSSVHPLQQTQQSQQLPPQQQQQSSLNNNNNNGNNNINNNNRRRHVMRKPSNKSTGRSIKTRTRPPSGKPPVA